MERPRRRARRTSETPLALNGPLLFHLAHRPLSKHSCDAGFFLLTILHDLPFRLLAPSPRRSSSPRPRRLRASSMCKNRRPGADRQATIETRGSSCLDRNIDETSRVRERVEDRVGLREESLRRIELSDLEWWERTSQQQA
jgi:hypothetical protein